MCWILEFSIYSQILSHWSYLCRTRTYSLIVHIKDEIREFFWMLMSCCIFFLFHLHDELFVLCCRMSFLHNKFRLKVHAAQQLNKKILIIPADCFSVQQISSGLLYVSFYTEQNHTWITIIWYRWERVEFDFPIRNNI